MECVMSIQAEILTSFLTKYGYRVYNIFCKDCDYVYNGETGRPYNIRLEEHKCSFKSVNLQSKLINHAIDTSHIPGFENITTIKYNGNDFKSRIF